MNVYCHSALHQIEIAIKTIIKMMDRLDEIDLEFRPTEQKHSIGELLQHISFICEADFHIINGATQEEMETFYSQISNQQIEIIKTTLLKNFDSLKTHYIKLSERELFQEKTSYWGITYTKYEWLLEILAHIYHHRGQLHAMLVHCYRRDPQVPLFE